MIFPSVQIDSVVQVEDRFRIDLEGSRTHDGSAIDTIKITPEVGGLEILVFDNNLDQQIKGLDWQYSSAGEKTVSIVFTKGDETKTVTKNVKVLTSEEDRLFSNDALLVERESNILSLLPSGRTSFIYAHRLAQKEILKDLNERGICVTKEQIADLEDVQRWSTFKALALIFESNITSVQDVHTSKKATYTKLATDSMNLSVIKLDKNKDGKADTKVQTFPTRLVRG